MTEKLKIYWIERRDQIEALCSPTRQDIADRLGAVGPCTVAVLAAALGYRPTALYQHLIALKRVGLVQALVFMLLTAVFTMLMCMHDEEPGGAAH